MHIEGSISYLLPLSEMQETGQLAAQAPQAMHLSVILYAMNFTTFSFRPKRGVPIGRYLSSLLSLTILATFCQPLFEILLSSIHFQV